MEGYQLKQFSHYQVIGEVMTIMNYELIKRMFTFIIIGGIVCLEIYVNRKRSLIYLSIYTVIGNIMYLNYINPILIQKLYMDRYLMICVHICSYYSLLIFPFLYRMAQYSLWLKMKEQNVKS